MNLVIKINRRKNRPPKAPEKSFSPGSQPAKISRRGLYRCLVLIFFVVSGFYLGGCSPVSDGDAPPPTMTPTATLSPETPLPTEAAPDLVETAPPPTSTPQVVDPGNLTVIYTGEDGLWHWQGGEPARLAGEAFFPSISPDGSLVVFLRPADAAHQEIWAVDLAGGDERRLVSIADLDRMGGGVRDPNAIAVNPTFDYGWLPGSIRLMFTTVQVFNGPGEDPLDDLHTVDAASGQITDVLLPGWGGRFAISPNAAQLAVVQPEAIFLTDPVGQNYTQVMSYGPVLTYSEAQFYAQPRWSLDGAFLRVAIPPKDALAAPDQITTLWRIPNDGSPAVQEGGVAAIFFVDSPVEYSPDLENIAYLKESDDGSGTRELHLAAFDGSADRVYASGEMLQFSGWAEDGRRFLFTRGDEGVVVLGSLDGEPRPLSPETNGAFRIRWIDQRRFIYTVLRDSAFELRLHDVDSGGDLLIDSLTGSPPVFDFYP